MPPTSILAPVSSCRPGPFVPVVGKRGSDEAPRLALRLVAEDASGAVTARAETMALYFSDEIDTPSDGKGVVNYRSADGTGTFTGTSVKRLWKYAMDGYTHHATVHGIVMVHVPVGASAAVDGNYDAHPFTLPFAWRLRLQPRIR